MQNFDLARQSQGERCTGGFRVLMKRACRRCGNRLNAIFDLAKRWQRAKAARRVLGGTCFAQVLKPSLNAVFRPGKARAKGDGKALARG